jgi:hypothetical protein
MWQSEHQPRIKKTCDFCNQSAFGLMRRHHRSKTFCSAYCEASFTNCLMVGGATICPGPTAMQAPPSVLPSNTMPAN